MGCDMDKFILILAFLFICSPVQAMDKLEPETVWTELLYVAVACMDWHQTLHIAGDPDEYSENNPLMRGDPSRSRVNLVFVTGLITHAAVTLLLPKEYRGYFQWATIGFESAFVLHNHWEGLH